MNVKKTLGIGIGAVIAGLGAYKYFTGKEPQKYSNKWFDTVRVFDSVLSKRAWGDETPHGPGYHREHGYNLYKDD